MQKASSCVAALALAAAATASSVAPAREAARPTTAAAQRSVTIKRDTWGVPHVYASTVHGLYYGYGYAVAQDRLFQMEMARRTFTGRVAEVLGEKHVAFDRSIRANYTPASLQRGPRGLRVRLAAPRSGARRSGCKIVHAGYDRSVWRSPPGRRRRRAQLDRRRLWKVAVGQ